MARLGLGNPVVSPLAGWAGVSASQSAALTLCWAGAPQEELSPWAEGCDG